MITDVDCMKYRKSTHLAKVDVEAIIAEKGACVLTIKLAFYDQKVDVNGTKQDGYFLRFEEEGVKDMMLNSGNRKKIANIVKDALGLSPVESRNLKNWAGITLNLKIDESRKFAGAVVGGIDIDTKFNQPKKATLIEAKAAFDAVDSRESFVAAMKDFKDFMQNPDIVEVCKQLAVKFPKQ